MSKNETEVDVNQNDVNAQGQPKMSPVNMFMRRFENEYKPVFINSMNGEPFVVIQYEGGTKVIKIEKNFCEAFLTLIKRKFVVGGGKNLLDQIILEMQARVLESKVRKKVNLRYAKDKDKDKDSIYVDLANEESEYVKIENGGKVEITKDIPVFMWTTPCLKPLPRPELINPKNLWGLWQDLLPFDKEGLYLSLVYVIKAMIPESGTCPILILEGPQGSGKSTAARILKMVLDPSSPDLDRAPKDEETIALTACLMHFLAFDNISYLSSSMADTFCRVSTGASLGKRKLYANGELVTFEFIRPTMFTTIHEISSRPDLMDRAIILKTQSFDNSRPYDYETEFWEKFEKIYPQLTGGLYTLLGKVLEALPLSKSQSISRLGEFERIGVCLDKILDLPDGHFQELYKQHTLEKTSTLFENDYLCQEIHKFLMKDGDFEGRTMDLLQAMRLHRDKGPGVYLPKTPKALIEALKRSKVVLESQGIEWGRLKNKRDRRQMYLKFKEGIRPTDNYEEIL